MIIFSRVEQIKGSSLIILSTLLSSLFPELFYQDHFQLPTTSSNLILVDYQPLSTFPTLLFHPYNIYIIKKRAIKWLTTEDGTIYRHNNWFSSGYRGWYRLGREASFYIIISNYYFSEQTWCSSSFIACKFTLCCKRWFYAHINWSYFSKY